MKTRLIVGILAVLTAGLNAGTLAPKLRARLQDAAAEAPIPVIAETRVQGDLRSLPPSSSYDDKVAYLRATAAEAQQDLLAWLQTVPAGNVKPFWLVSRVALHVPSRVILELAAREDVATVWLDDTFRLDPIRPNRASRDATDGPTWNIVKIKADSCWADGYTGTGIVVGNIDTGVEATHPAFGGRWREENGWFDAVNGYPTPYDDDVANSHGTHTMGLLTGGDGPGPYAHDIGVAPGATFVAAKAMDGQGNGRDSWIEAALNWMADPGRPDVLSNSWGTHWGGFPFWSSIMRLRELGIILVFSAGNEGPGSGTLREQGSFPIVICVGASTIADTIATYSSRGPAPDQWPWNEPVYWSRPDWNFIGPSVAAPGDSTLSAKRGDTFGLMGGTSSACPHVAGCCALLKQKYPFLNHDEMMQRITNSADHVPPADTWPNNTYGWGRLNCRRALEPLPCPLVRVETVRVAEDENHNDTLDPGETGNLVVRLRNTGGAPATDLRGVLRGCDNWVTVLDSTTNLGLLPGLDTVSTAGDPLVLRADPSCPLGHTARLTLALHSSETTWTSQIPLRVGAGGVQFWLRELNGLPGNPSRYPATGIAYNPADNRLYVTCEQTNFIHIYSSDSLVELLDSIRAPDSSVSCCDIAFSPDDTTFWVLSYHLGSARVSKLRPDGTRLRHFTSPASTWPVGIAWDRDAHRLYHVESEYDPPSRIHVTDTLGTPLDTIDIPLGGNSGAKCLTRDVNSGNPYRPTLVNAYEFYVYGHDWVDSAGIYMLRSDNGAVIDRLPVHPPGNDFHISGVEYDPRDASYWVTFCARSTPYHRIAKYSGFYPAGVSEPDGPRRPMESRPHSSATIVRGVLIPPPASSHNLQTSSLLDISGRKVLDLQPGPNDVSRLAPGVYFVRPPCGDERRTPVLRRIILSR